MSIYLHVKWNEKRSLHGALRVHWPRIKKKRTGLGERKFRQGFVISSFFSLHLLQEFWDFWWVSSSAFHCVVTFYLSSISFAASIQLILGRPLFLAASSLLLHAPATGWSELHFEPQSTHKRGSQLYVGYWNGWGSLCGNVLTEVTLPPKKTS